MACEYSTCYCDRIFNPSCSPLREKTCFYYLIFATVSFGLVIIYFSWTLFKENLYSFKVKLGLKNTNARTMIILFLYFFLITREVRQLLQVTQLFNCALDYYIYYYIAYYFIIVTFSVIIFLWMKLANTLNCFSLPEILKIRNYIIATDIILFFLFALVGISQLFLNTYEIILFGNVVISIVIVPISFLILTRNHKIQKGLAELRESFTNANMVFYGQKIQQVTTRTIYLLFISFVVAVLAAIVSLVFDLQLYYIALWELIFRIVEILVCLTFMPIVFKKQTNHSQSANSQSANSQSANSQSANTQSALRTSVTKSDGEL